MKMVEEGLEAYARFGFTTASESRAFPSDVDLFAGMAERGPTNVLDVIAYPDFWLGKEKVKNSPWLESRVQTPLSYWRCQGEPRRLPSGQDRMAHRSRIMCRPPDGMADYVGYPMLEEEQAVAMFDESFANGWQLINHANGDAAIDQMIRAARAATAKYGSADRRTVGVHSQTIREDQLDAYKELGIIPSFFGMHTFYWGDWHRDSVLGPERAARISPAKSAADRGMIFTQHHDAPVALPTGTEVCCISLEAILFAGEAQRRSHI